MSGLHPIEVESYRILRARIDLSHWPPLSRAVVERMIHASADLDYADTTRLEEDAARAGVAAVAAGAPIVVDAAMVRAGITRRAAYCAFDEHLGAGPTDGRRPTADRPPTDGPAGPTAAPEDGLTRSARAFRRAAERHPDGAVFVVATAPTALYELIRLVEAGEVRPALVVGLPVGFVGAAEAKEALRASPAGRRSLSNVGEKGGSAVAAAAVNALVRLAEELTG
jgi:precorrin-8X/cobalt-precorrin-8 methylmutase